jgi:hypothetical protein
MHYWFSFMSIHTQNFNPKTNNAMEEKEFIW